VIENPLPDFVGSVTPASHLRTPRLETHENKIVCGSRTCKPNSPGHVAATEVIEAESWLSVKNVKIVSVGRFCVTPASQSAVAYRVLRNAIGMKTPRRREGLRLNKNWETTAWPRPFAPEPAKSTLNVANGFYRNGGTKPLGHPAHPAKSTLKGRCNCL
jgi:hypothetical protein